MSSEQRQLSDGTETRIRGVVADVFGLKPEDVGPGLSRDTVAGWDSLQHITLVLSLEEEFAIYFDDEDTVSLVTFPLIVAIVKERLGEAALPTDSGS